MPICSLASATRRSAAAMSGRRSSSWDGMPTGMSGGGVASGRGDRPKAAGGFPMSVAIACSSCARCTVMSVACACVVSSWVWAWATSDFGAAQDVAGAAMPDARYGARVRCQEGTVPGVADGGGAGAGRDRREQRGPIEADQSPGLTQPGLGDPEILVGGGDLLLQSVELGVPEDRPPLTARQVIARLRGLPAIHLLVRGCHGRRRPFVFRADHAAAEEDGDEPGEAGRSSCHGLGAAGARAIRTRVPLMIESEGATMTWSVGCKPVTISTVLP